MPLSPEIQAFLETLPPEDEITVVLTSGPPTSENDSGLGVGLVQLPAVDDVAALGIWSACFIAEAISHYLDEQDISPADVPGVLATVLQAFQEQLEASIDEIVTLPEPTDA